MESLALAFFSLSLLLLLLIVLLLLLILIKGQSSPRSEPNHSMSEDGYHEQDIEEQYPSEEPVEMATYADLHDQVYQLRDPGFGTHPTIPQLGYGYQQRLVPPRIPAEVQMGEAYGIPPYSTILEVSRHRPITEDGRPDPFPDLYPAPYPTPEAARSRPIAGVARSRPIAEVARSWPIPEVARSWPVPEVDGTVHSVSSDHFVADDHSVSDDHFVSDDHSVSGDMSIPSIDSSAPTPARHIVRALAQSSLEEHRNLLGEYLYPLVYALVGETAGKITGMLVELGLDVVLDLLSSPVALKEMVSEGIETLRKLALDRERNPNELASLSTDENPLSQPGEVIHNQLEGESKEIEA